MKSDDLAEVVERRELYRRCVGMADRFSATADRIWYTLVKRDDRLGDPPYCW